MPTVRKLRVVNPHKNKSHRHTSSRKRKKNIGEGVLYVMSNPRRKRHNASRSCRSRNRKHVARNPFVRRARHTRGHRNYRRNPNIAGFNGAELLKLSLGAAAGSIGSRFLTQAFLKDKNTGVMGYGVNALAAVALAWGAAKFLGKDVAAGVAAGGLAGVIMRIWTEQVSGTSAAALSGYLGDLDFASDGLGAYIDSGFPLPTTSTLGPNGYIYVPPAGPQLARASQASAAPQVNVQPSDPAGLSRFASRF